MKIDSVLSSVRQALISIEPVVAPALRLFAVSFIYYTIWSGNLDQTVWNATTWFNVLAVLSILYWGALRRTVTLTSMSMLAFLSYLLSWGFTSDQWFLWTHVNSNALRMALSFCVAALAIGTLMRAHLPYANRMMLIGGLGLIGWQAGSATLLNLSYLSQEQRVQDHQRLVVSHPNAKTVHEECARLGWWCRTFEAHAHQPPSFPFDWQTVSATTPSRAFLQAAMDDPTPSRFHAWTWHDSWSIIPDATWPLSVMHWRDAHSTQWILVDTTSLRLSVKQHRRQFAWWSASTNIAWIFAVCVFWWVQQRRWRRENNVWTK